MWFDRKLSAETQPKMTAVEIFKKKKRRHTVIKFSFPRKVLSLTVHCCLCENFSFSCTGGVGNFKINLDANMLSRVFFITCLCRCSVQSQGNWMCEGNIENSLHTKQPSLCTVSLIWASVVPRKMNNSTLWLIIYCILSNHKGWRETDVIKYGLNKTFRVRSRVRSLPN